jgi:hypothetical protein
MAAQAMATNLAHVAAADEMALTFRVPARREI